MQDINTGRWLAGGLAAAGLIWIIEGSASMIYMNDMRTALEAHGLTFAMNAVTWILSIAVSGIVGLTLVFLYAAARPRFGPGPRTAVIVAVAMWFAGYLVSLLGYSMIGLYAPGMLAMWGAIGIVELILAALLGGWIYREGPAGAVA
jgi:hypothetical protein